MEHNGVISDLQLNAHLSPCIMAHDIQVALFSLLSQEAASPPY